MKRFQNILYAAFSTQNETAALTQALILGRDNNAAVDVLYLYPGLPDSLAEQRSGYERWLLAEFEERVRQTRADLGLNESVPPVEIRIDSGPAPATRIIRETLRGGHDLVLTEARSATDGRGFDAVDMELLRKCPSPVWLARRLTRPRNELRVAAAIDPECDSPAEHDLAIRMLRLSRSLADSGSGRLDIVSCWDYPFEEHLRTSPWVSLDDARIVALASESGNRHRLALESLIEESGIGGQLRVAHVRGKPEEQIPGFVERSGIDLLVMGTVARTGIPGFLIGNTAENIIGKIGCSLLALKPAGFVSPVSAY